MYCVIFTRFKVISFTIRFFIFIFIFQSRPIPWGKIVRSRAVWALTVAKFAGTWGFTSLLTKLPAYLADVLHFPIQKVKFPKFVGNKKQS